MSTLTASQSTLDSAQYTALDKLVKHHHYHHPSPPSVESTVEAFCSPVENEFMSNQHASALEPLLRTGWAAVVAHAAALPFDSESEERHRLADFVLKLQQRPALQKGESVAAVEEMTVWKDLPLLGWQMREAWNGAATSQSPSQQISHWLNLNAFTATLVEAAHKHSHDSPDFSLYGIWTIRSALEQSDPSSSSSTSSSSSSSSSSLDHVSLEAAALWLIHAPRAIRDYSRAAKVFQGKVAKPGPGHDGAGWTGYSDERWASWKKGLEHVEANIDDRRAKDMAKEALGTMRAMENQ